MLRHGLRPDRSNGKKRNYLWIAYAILGVAYVALTAFFFAPFSFVLGYGFGEAGMMAELVTFFLLTAAGPVLVLGLIALVSTLYFARDSEFFAYLPVQGSTVFFAKLTVVYLVELIFATIIALPMIIAAGIGATVGGVTMGPLFYIFSILGLLTAPLLILLVAAILSLPAMYIISFFKARGAVTSIVVILFFGLIMLGYSMVIGLVSTSDGGDSGYFIDFNQITAYMVNAMAGGLGVVRYILLPVYALVALGTGQGLWGLSGFEGVVVNIICVILPTAFIVTIAGFISGAIYQKGAAAQLEGNGNTRSLKSKDKVNSAKKALTKREFREMLRTPSFAFQCLAGAVITPIMSLSLLFGMRGLFVAGTDPISNIESIALRITLPLVVMFIVTILGVNLNNGASTIISREGKKYYYAKIIPVSYKTQFDAKVRIYYLMSMISSASTVIFAIVFFPSVWYHFLLMSGFVAIYSYAHVHFASSFDLSDPKLNWTNPTSAVKNSKNVLIPYFTGMGISAVLLVIFAVPYILISWLLPFALPASNGIIIARVIATIVSWAIIYAIVITMAILFRRRAVRNLDMWYDRMYS